MPAAPLAPLLASTRSTGGKDLLASLLDINVPVVAAIAGQRIPARGAALLSDIVIAADDAGH